MKARQLAIASWLLIASGAHAQGALPFEVEAITSFDEPWALAFLPDGRLLVTEKKGSLYIVARDGKKSRPVGNVPDSYNFV